MVLPENNLWLDAVCFRLFLPPRYVDVVWSGEHDDKEASSLFPQPRRILYPDNFTTPSSPQVAELEALFLNLAEIDRWALFSEHYCLPVWALAYISLRAYLLGSRCRLGHRTFERTGKNFLMRLGPVQYLHWALVAGYVHVSDSRDRETSGCSIMWFPFCVSDANCTYPEIFSCPSSAD